MGTMVRVIVAVLLLTATAVTGAAAQATVGLQGGIIHSTLTGGQVVEPEADLGIHGQLSLTVPLARGPVGFRAAAAFTQRGATYRFSGISGKEQAGLDYVQLPLTITLNTTSQRRLSVHAFGGIAPSVLVSCKYQLPGSLALTDPCDELIRGTYFEWLAGAGVTMHRGDTAIVLDALFNQGLSSIFKSIGGVKTRAITLIAGVELPLRRADTP